MTENDSKQIEKVVRDLVELTEAVLERQESTGARLETLEKELADAPAFNAQLEELGLDDLEDLLAYINERRDKDIQPRLKRLENNKRSRRAGSVRYSS